MYVEVGFGSMCSSTDGRTDTEGVIVVSPFLGFGNSLVLQSGWLLSSSSILRRYVKNFSPLYKA